MKIHCLNSTFAIRARLILLAIAFLFQAATASLSAESDPKLQTSSGTSNEDQIKKMTGVIKSKLFEIRFDPQFKVDAEKEAGYLEQGTDALKKEFSEFPVEDLLKVHCQIFMYPRRTDWTNEALAHINSDDISGVYEAKIEVLTPSSYPASYRTKVHEPISDDVASRLIVHEYSTILLDQISKQKKTGVHFHDSPKWFEQGYEEYCGLMLSPSSNRTAVVEKYLDLYRKDPNRVDLHFGIQVKNDYTDGAMLLLFMNEKYGKTKVQSILTSQQPTFGQAAVISLGVSLSEFAQDWDKWLKSRLARPSHI